MIVGYSVPLFRTGDPCRGCKHPVKFHKKWTRNGALAERCEKEGYFWSLSLGRLVKGLCPCKGYIPTAIDYSQLRCTVCGRSVNKFHEINKLGQRRCENCGALFGNEFRSLDFQKDLRK